MSGGFFRGTSADQDTRFSNKQAKLLKSQKFAPELEHLVDMTKVKLDVIRPWIATRVTELLGFEDEVLINFIYSLLDGKEVNGKEVQISLTGFMEKNTGKFMKELWTLLLSAQKNASGVPQQFLDAKEEETRKKKMDADRIASEIQKKKEKEGRELDQERLKKMDGAVEIKGTNAALDSNSRTVLAKDSSIQTEDEKGRSERNGVRGRNRGSPTQSISQSHSNSRSYSDGKHKSRSASTSPETQRRSISSDRVRRSSRGRSITPHRRHSPQISLSPSRQRSSYSRQRSRSRSLHRSPPPIRHKLPSPFQRRSPSPVHRRSPSPVHRRLPSPVRRRRSPSPVRRRRSPSPIRRRRSPSPIRRRRSPSPLRRHRSPSPVRRRRSPSPIRRHRSPSPVRRRRSPSPVRHRRSPSPIRRRRPRSPVRRRRSPSPIRHRRSPSPIRRRRSPSPVWSGSPSPVRCRSPSLMRRRYQKSSLTPQHRSSSPIGQRSPVPACSRLPTASQRRSPPYESSSPSPTGHRSPSLVRRSPSSCSKSPVQSPVEGTRTLEKLSPVARRSSSPLRSPERGPKGRNDLRDRKPAFSPSPERFPTVSKSPPHGTRRRSCEDRRSFSPYVSPARQTRNTTIRDGNSSLHEPREWKTRQDVQETSKEDKETNCSWEDGDYKSVSSCRRSVHSSTANKQKESRDQVSNREDYSPKRRVSGRHVPESRSHNDKMDSRKNNQELKSDRQRSPTFYKDSSPGERLQSSYPGESKKSDERNLSRSNNGKDSDRHGKSENAAMAVDKVDNSNRSDTVDSGSGESYKHRTENKEKRKHKKYEREEASDNDYSNDSEIERKQAKRRRKEEKKLRKEEKRRRRDERRRRREERRAEKLKLKNHNDVDASDDEHVSRRASYGSDHEVTESEQKKLEIELRNKALESIKAKKNSSH